MCVCVRVFSHSIPHTHTSGALVVVFKIQSAGGAAEALLAALTGWIGSGLLLQACYKYMYIYIYI